MRTIGILGGMSSVASAEYYRRVNAGVNARLGGHGAAEVVLYSVDFAMVEAFIRQQRWDQPAEYLAERGCRLERAGADFVILATSTMHKVAGPVQEALGIPLIHIVDPTADAATADGARTLGLLGTAPVMEADFYRGRFVDHGVEVLVPAGQDRALVHRAVAISLGLYPLNTERVSELG